MSRLNPSEMDLFQGRHRTLVDLSTFVMETIIQLPHLRAPSHVSDMIQFHLWISPVGVVVTIRV